ncbi:MAG: hypothetical protein E7613_05985 [Ruminococcaceae bacterium]|nr:hypothetical protein [Oscillospiraceae bacterium]
MSGTTDKNKTQCFYTVTERFCSKLGSNTIIVTTRTDGGKKHRCIHADKCNAECEHRKSK